MAHEGIIFSSKVLLAMVDTGISREDALRHRCNTQHAMKVWEDIQRVP